MTKLNVTHWRRSGFRRFSGAASGAAAMLSLLAACATAPTTGEPVPVTAKVGCQTPSGPPPYPAASLKAGEQGIVGVAALISAEGKFLKGEIRRSSGYPRLDEATIAAAATWCWKPKNEKGLPVEAWHEFDYTWNLE